MALLPDREPPRPETFDLDWKEEVRFLNPPRTRWQTMCACTRSFLIWLIPSPVADLRSSRRHGGGHNNKIAALDGLRGVACLFVLNGHWACAVDDPWREGITERISGGIMWAPFVGLVWNGLAMVNIFFVISGYVLAYKPLKLLHSGEDLAVYQAIASSIFRRALRLFVPTMVMLLLMGALVQLRLFARAQACYDIMDGLAREHPPHLLPFWKQAWSVLKECYKIIWAAHPGRHFSPETFIYDPHIWTIPVEFKSSMVLFLLLTGTSLLRTGWRLLIHACFMAYLFFTENRDACMFVGGLILAEIDQLRKRRGLTTRLRSGFSLLSNGSQPPSLTVGSAPKDWNLRPIAWVLVFVVGLYVLSVPLLEPVTVPGYEWMAALLPDYVQNKNRLIRVVGSLFTTWAVANSDILAPLFTNPVSQYLGKISFALYLTHGFMIKSLGYNIIFAFRNSMDVMTSEATTPGQFLFIWVGGYILMLPFIFWVADLFWRGVDVPSVTFARYLENKVKRLRE